MAKLVDALDLGSSEQPSWEFESLRPHFIRSAFLNYLSDYRLYILEQNENPQHTVN